MRMVKVRAASLLSISTFPLWRWVISWAIDKPIPVPSFIDNLVLLPFGLKKYRSAQRGIKRYLSPYLFVTAMISQLIFSSSLWINLSRRTLKGT